MDLGKNWKISFQKVMFHGDLDNKYKTMTK